jgi:hypothetical protein
VAGEQVGSHKLTVTQTEALARPAGCQVLFISRSEREKISSKLLQLAKWIVSNAGARPGP